MCVSARHVVRAPVFLWFLLLEKTHTRCMGRYDLALVPAYAPSQHLFVTDLARLARVELRSSTPIAYFRGERTSRTHGNCVDAYLAAHVAELCSETMVVSGNDDDEHAVAMTHGEIADPASARALASQHSELRSRLIHELLPEVARQRRHEMREAEWGPGPCSLTRYTQRMSGGAAASTPDDNEVFSQFFMVDLHHEQRQQSRACAAAPFVLRRSSRGGVLSGTAGSN